MGDYIQILLFTISGIILLMIGYYLFFGPLSPIYPYLPWSKKGRSNIRETIALCPICAYKIPKGDQLKTVVFPSKSNGIDHIMHIKGCFTCLSNNVPRRCPVCKSRISKHEFLLARMFERPHTKNHVHVLGCTKCRRV